MQTVKIMLVVAVSASALATAVPARAQEPPAIQKHIDAARELAGTRYQRAMTRLCLPRNGRPRPEFPTSVAPVRVFDNLYFVGLPDVYSWALDTSEGIVLFDALNNARDAEMTIVGGLQQLGLDPARIRYVVISHEHADHYGGARYLQDRFGARIVASDMAWRAMEEKRDMVVADGDRLIVGATTLTFYSTPGHTAGALSTLVPVTEGGQRHLAFLLGGPRTVSLATSREMVASTERIATLARSAGVDVELNDHSYIDDSLPLLEAARRRQPGEANPFIVGAEGFQRFAGWQIACLNADVARGEY